MRNRYLGVIAVSVSIISIELAWTRIFSAEFWYSFAFLILSLAVMGLGLGALTLRLFPKLNNQNYMGPLLALTGMTAVAGPPLVFLLDLNMGLLFNSPEMLFRFVVAMLLLNSTYFFGGIVLALAFRGSGNKLPKLYMADLISAACGIVLIIIAMNKFTTPVATFLAALPVVLASLVISKKAWKVLPLLLLMAMIVLGYSASDLLKQDREERAPVIYENWDATAKVKVFDYSPDYRGFQIDNAAHSPLYGFDGNWDRPDSLRFEFGIDVSWLLEKQENSCFLSLGAGGGTDVLQALQAGATEVHAVEVIPQINAMMLEGEVCDFTGRIYHDPRVKVVTEDARAYVRRFNNKFDIIYSLSSNTFAALTSGSFALAENYLFTTEAYRDYWNSLSDRGFMMMEHQFYMVRLVTELEEGLKMAGVENPRDHYAIYNLPSMRRKMLLLSKAPLTNEIIQNAFGPLTPERAEDIALLFPAPEGSEENLINRIVDKGWQSQQDSVAVDLSPCNDNRPYVSQMGLWKNFSFDKLEKVLPYEVMGFPLAKMLIVIILGLGVLIIVPLNLLPYVFKGEKLGARPWLYFFFIGLGFMSVEVILIQKYALFIGGSLHSITTVLLTLFLASGIGSRFSDSVSDRTAFAGLILCLVLEIFLFGFLRDASVGLSQVPRMIVSAILIAPLGFFMGMPFPKGGLRVGGLIDWGFAVNGVASVIGATLILLVAFLHGFSAALILSALFYGVSYLLMSDSKSW